jgi:hypothetical protein
MRRKASPKSLNKSWRRRWNFIARAVARAFKITDGRVSKSTFPLPARRMLRLLARKVF